jgi:hypothetical protein
MDYFAFQKTEQKFKSKSKKEIETFPASFYKDEKPKNSFRKDNMDLFPLGGSSIHTGIILL